MKHLSIIIPFYNTQIKYIDYLIEKSGLDLYPQYEVIWIDDGSVDTISNYVKNICLTNDWIFYRFNKNYGVSNARNKGIELANTNYLMFLDSDDVVDLKQLSKFDIYGEYDIVLFKDTIFIDEIKFNTTELSILETKQTISQLYCSNAYRLNLRSSCCKILKKQIITSNSICFDTDLSFYEDAMFMCRYYVYCNSFVAFDNTLYYYRIHNNSSGKRFNKNFMQKFEVFYNRFKKTFNDNVYLISGLEQDTFVRMLIDKVIRSTKHCHFLYCFTILKSFPVNDSAKWIVSNFDKNYFEYKVALLVVHHHYLLAYIKIFTHQLLKSIKIRIRSLNKKVMSKK